MADLDVNETDEVTIADAAGINKLSVSSSGAAKVDGSAVTQPISGTVTSNQGTANSIANCWPVKITDGTYSIVPNSDGSINTKSIASTLADQDKAFQISTSITITGSGTENNFFLLNNPSSSGKKLKLIDISIGFNNTVNVMAVFKLYASPTITSNGTSITIVPGRIGTSVPTSSVNAYSNPTISVRGTEYTNFMVTGGPSSGSSYRFSIDQSVILDAGHDILLTGTPDGTNRNVLLTIRWLEV